jgi:lipocalin-like protein
MKSYRPYIFGFSLLMLATICFAQTKPRSGEDRSGIASELVGTWRLTSIEEKQANRGVVDPPQWARNPVGIIIYDAKGNIAVQIMNSGRVKFTSQSSDKVTVEEKAAAYDGYLAYFGTYEINEKEGFIIHHLKGHLSPNPVGTDFKRDFEYLGDRLILSTAPTVKGEKRIRRFTWERVK